LPDVEPEAWAVTELEEFRRSKDEFFAAHPQSPLTPEQQADFAGLAHWSCPLPPVENWLEVPIRAGEKEFPAGTASSPGGAG
jgi:uncharacterized protein (DUF1684 family)